MSSDVVWSEDWIRYCGSGGIAEIEAVDTYAFKHGFLGRIAYTRRRYEGSDLVDLFLVDIHSHDMIAEVTEILCEEFSEFSHSDYKY